jgi:hypothetical protein
MFGFVLFCLKPCEIFEVTESVEVDEVSDEIRRWSSLSEDEYQLFVSDEDGVLNDFEMM